MQPLSIQNIDLNHSVVINKDRTGEDYHINVLGHLLILHNTCILEPATLRRRKVRTPTNVNPLTQLLTTKKLQRAKVRIEAQKTASNTIQEGGNKLNFDSNNYEEVAAATPESNIHVFWISKSKWEIETNLIFLYPNR